MVDYRKGSHTIYDIKYHVVWVTKYRYKVLSKGVGERLRELIRQGCETIGVAASGGGIICRRFVVMVGSKEKRIMREKTASQNRL